jgi:MoaA/NifB/PqqE/SkfB family radical SAM enzyme
LKCDYCINFYDGIREYKRQVISGKKWVLGLNRLLCPEDLPVTLQGGEPSLHPDFLWIIKNIRKDLHIDILTNLSFDIDEFINNIEPARLNRGAPYPNIRVTYHPERMDLDVIIKKVLKMQCAGFSIGIFAILHPRIKKKVLEAQEKCLNLGIDFRTKEFLGVLNGKVRGIYFYPQAVYNVKKKKCLCRTSELILDPDGDVFRCHRDLYRGCNSIGNLLDDSFKIRDIFRSCCNFGDCNPCDIKIKTNRFQISGHHAIEIKSIKG